MKMPTPVRIFPKALTGVAIFAFTASLAANTFTVTNTGDTGAGSLRQAITNARLAMKSEAGESALRRRAEALQAVIQRIECTFVATGETKTGRRRSAARSTRCARRRR